jgi:hypothetical protein
MDALQKNSQPSKAQAKSKTQPWKKAWPPQTKEKAGEKHGFAKGEVLEVGGTSGAAMDYKRDESDD